MEHSDEEELILRYLDGECDEIERRQVEHLLHTDTAFEQIFKEYKTLEEHYKSYKLIAHYTPQIEKLQAQYFPKTPPI